MDENNKDNKAMLTLQLSQRTLLLLAAGALLLLTAGLAIGMNW